MKKVCIFRVWGNKHWYRVYRCCLPNGSIAYEVYSDRRHIAGVWLYLDFEIATEVAVSLAKADVLFISDGENVQ